MLILNKLPRRKPRDRVRFARRSYNVGCNHSYGRNVELGYKYVMFRTRARRCIIGITLLLTTATTLAKAQQTFRSSAGDVTVETVASGLEHPWALAFLPDGRMLVTERPGRLRIVTRRQTFAARGWRAVGQYAKAERFARCRD